MLQIHNSLTGRKETFLPIRQGEVRMYVCGMTVYDYCHLGHARMLVVFDVVRRHLEASGYRGTFVRNITDIDDPGRACRWPTVSPCWGWRGCLARRCRRRSAART